MPEANHKIRETCLICEGRGKASETGNNCAYCQGTGIVFAVTGGSREVMLATGDCKIPMRRKFT